MSFILASNWLSFSEINLLNMYALARCSSTADMRCSGSTVIDLALRAISFALFTTPATYCCSGLIPFVVSIFNILHVVVCVVIQGRVVLSPLL